MGIKAPRLIRDRCGVYYFRLVVPLSWRAAVGKAEIRRSLRTRDSGLAREAALLLSARMEAILANNKGSNAGELPADLARWIASPTEANKLIVRVFNGEAHIEADTLDEAKEARAMVADLVRGGLGHGAGQVAQAAQAAMSALPSSRCGTALEQAKADFLAERKTTLSEKGTLPKMRGVLASFIEFNENTDVAMVQPAGVKDYKKKLLAEGKAPTTINDHIVILTGFFDYCIDNKIAAMANPARGLLIPGAHNKAESYLPFKAEELARIFEPAAYLKRMKLPDFHWGPLIALFTGARAEEIASLELDQVRREKGIWIIDILKGKTENAERRVPLHDKLLELGLPEYCEAARAAGHKMLFPYLVDGKNGFKKNMCRMFGVHLDSPAVDIVHELKVFHSFRHTVVTMLTDKGVNEGQKRALVGHDIDSRDSSHDDYTHLSALTLPNLRVAINKLDYEGIDFAALKKPGDHFLAAIAKRIKQREARERKSAERARARAAAGLPPIEEEEEDGDEE